MTLLFFTILLARFKDTLPVILVHSMFVEFIAIDTFQTSVVPPLDMRSENSRPTKHIGCRVGRE